jgi:hypothetical protein
MYGARFRFGNSGIKRFGQISAKTPRMSNKACRVLLRGRFGQKRSKRPRCSDPAKIRAAKNRLAVEIILF